MVAYWGHMMTTSGIVYQVTQQRALIVSDVGLCPPPHFSLLSYFVDITFKRHFLGEEKWRGENKILGRGEGFIGGGRGL